MDEYNKISRWVEDLPKRGKVTFSKEEVIRQFPNMTNLNINNMLYRLALKKKVQSVWRSFFMVVLTKYGLRGVVPPIEYIDQLMRFLGKNYYVSLQSAAALQGASHQQPQELMVMTDSGILRDKIKKETKINFVTKKNIPTQYIKQIMTDNGYINISIPELTAFDVVIYAKNVGGINRVATILNELAEFIDFKNIDIKLFDIAIIQRLGYLLDVLGYENLANTLYQKSNCLGIRFRKYPLTVAPIINFAKYPVDKKWKIIINEEIEVDE